MSPLRLEAVYERRPLDPERSAAAAVRWGFRASLGAERTGPDQRRATDPPRPARALPASIDTAGGPRSGPREATWPDPSLLAYSRSGIPLPLPSMTGTAAGIGHYLDLRG